MSAKIEVREIIAEVLMKLDRKSAQDLKAGSNVIIFGQDGVLDSLDLVTFLLELESAIYLRTQKKIVFLSDISFLSKASPFKDTQSLERYILKSLSTLETV